jgi:drug/metabolite transporter (DMT)-like permease
VSWLLVALVVTATVASDLLQSFEMKRHGEVSSLSPTALGRLAAAIVRRRLLVLAVACMAVSFFAFLQLLAIADLSFAVPATAATYVLETVLARAVLRERVAAGRWAAAALVASGVWLLAW